jgi:hypothetical protein
MIAKQLELTLPLGNNAHRLGFKNEDFATVYRHEQFRMNTVLDIATNQINKTEQVRHDITEAEISALEKHKKIGARNQSNEVERIAKKSELIRHCSTSTIERERKSSSEEQTDPTTVKLLKNLWEKIITNDHLTTVVLTREKEMQQEYRNIFSEWGEFTGPKTT